MKQSFDLERLQKMRGMRDSGHSQKFIAESFGISKQAVCAIFKLADLAKKLGYESMADMSSFETYGVSSYVKNSFDNEVKSKYCEQKSKSLKRNIEWNFTLETWWRVWESSGKWKERGRKVGQFVMARNGDIGPYCPLNVEIVTSRKNHQERMLNNNFSGKVVDIEKAYGLYLSGFSTVKLAEIYGVSSQAISQLFSYHKKQKFSLRQRRKIASEN